MLVAMRGRLEQVATQETGLLLILSALPNERLEAYTGPVDTTSVIAEVPTRKMARSGPSHLDKSRTTTPAGFLSSFADEGFQHPMTMECFPDGIAKTGRSRS